jgi:hypothetical protein
LSANAAHDASALTGTFPSACRFHCRFDDATRRPPVKSGEMKISHPADDPTADPQRSDIATGLSVPLEP